MRIHGPAELVVRERLVEVTLARVVDDESAANADHECGAAVRLLDAGAEPRLIEQSGCATDSNSGGDRVTGVGAEGTHTPDRFAGGAGLLTHLALPSMPPAAISTPRFALIRWVSPPDSTSAPTTRPSSTIREVRMDSVRSSALPVLWTAASSRPISARPPIIGPGA